MTISQPDDRPSSLPHSYRRTGRASFLFPSWLHSHPHTQLHLRHYLKRLKIKLALTLKRFFFNSSLDDKASQAYLSAILHELEVRDFGENPPTWQKNLLHQKRQNQLACFETLLKAHDLHASKRSHEASLVSTFPEIMLVMAKTLTESNHNQPELTDSAHELINAYQRLTDYLFEQGKKWKMSHLSFETSDLFISYLLDFRKTWTFFRETRLQQIHLQPSSDHTLPNPLTNHFNQMSSKER